MGVEFLDIGGPTTRPADFPHLEDDRSDHFFSRRSLAGPDSVSSVDLESEPFLTMGQLADLLAREGYSSGLNTVGPDVGIRVGAAVTLPNPVPAISVDNNPATLPPQP
jgi:hypothetical protein